MADEDTQRLELGNGRQLFGGGDRGGPRERVVIVDVEDARLVLGVTASNVNVLHKLPPAPAISDERAETPADFQSVMKSLLKRSGRS